MRRLGGTEPKTMPLAEAIRQLTDEAIPPDLRRQ
jgi:hypothetical protein